MALLITAFHPTAKARGLSLRIICNGIMFGILAWVIGKVVTKKTKDITVPTIVIAIIFLIYLILK